MTHPPRRFSNLPAEGPADARAFARVRLGGDVRLLTEDGAGVVSRLGQFVDISEGGCQIKVYRPIALETRAHLRSALLGHRLSIPVEVRWASDDDGSWRIGCKFVEMPPEQRRAVLGIIERRRTLSPPGP